jgi:long-chain acyl-CoA synthetase
MEKTWLKSYPSDVPETLSVNGFQSINEMIERNCQLFGKKTAFLNFGVAITYHELDQLSEHFAAFLQQQLKMKKGERFAIMLPNVLQFPIVMLAALRAGLVVMNINPLYTATELAFQLKDSGATAIIVLENFAHELSLALPQTLIQHVIVTKMGDCLGWKGPIVNGVVKYVKRMVPHWQINNSIDYKNALKIGKTSVFEKVVLQGEDVAFLQYTGGTTGVAKGAMLSHGNIIANVTQCLAWVKSTLKPGHETVLTALPLYHIFSLTVCCFCFMALGAKCLLVTNPRDLKGFIKLLHKTPPSIFVGVNTLFNGVLQHPQFSKIKVAALKLVIAGGMAMQKAVADEWQKRTGKVVIEGYGLTEASPVVSINPLTLKNFNGSIGLPVPETEVVIRDDAGQDMPLGKPGELCVRGPQVMLGYWQKPEETALVLDQQGWLRTGDIAKIDERGFIYILDRKKDMVIVSGFNVYPNEVEAVIATDPRVSEVAVVGVPSEKSGEMVKAFIVKKDPALTAEAVLDYCRERLTGYKLPKEIEFRTSLPKSNVGKVLRRVLKDEEIKAKHDGG